MTPIKIPKTFFLLFILSVSFLSAQTVINKGENHIYKGRVTGISSYGELNQSFIKDFSVGIKWSVYLGEPVESYSFKWNSSNSFSVKLNGQTKTFTKSQISEYPDLAAKLKKVKPVSVDVVVYGDVYGKSVSVKRGSTPRDVVFYANNQSTYKKNGQSYDRYTLQTQILYKIGNQNFLFGYSGQERSGSIVGTSPDWNNFISWKQRTSNVSQANSNFDYLVQNVSKNEYKNLSSDKKSALNKKFKTAYINSNKLSLKAEISKIDWGNQLISIANTYLKYKKEGKKPKKKDDFWDDEKSSTNKNTDDFWEDESSSKKNQDGFWESDRLKVKVLKPLNNTISNKNVVDFEAEYNIFSDTFKGYLEYNGINQRLIPINGKFSGKMVLKSGVNYITFKIKSIDNTIYTEEFKVTYTGKPVKLRATLVWDNVADIDLYLKDANGNICSYQNKRTSLSVLDVDNTNAYGPENISVEKIISGNYEIYIKNFSGTSGVNATVYVYLDEKLYSTKTHTFNGYNDLKTILSLKL